MLTSSIFVSYSHKDEDWLDRLVTHLGVIKYQQLLEVWTDRRIEAGSGWLEDIRAAIGGARIAVLLITPNFLNSEFIRTEEVPRLLQGRAGEGLNVIPIIVKPCAWELVPWIKQMQVRPKDGRPLSSGEEHAVDQHLADITHEIYQLLVRNRGVAGHSLDEKARAPGSGVRALGDNEPLPPEIAADPSSIGAALLSDAVEVVGTWLDALREGDFAIVWELSDQNWRLCRAQAWIWNNRELLGLADLRAAQQIAEEFSEVRSQHPLWPEFARIERSQLSQSLAGKPAGQWAFATRRRSVGPGYELFLFTLIPDDSRGYVVNKATDIEGKQILAHLTSDGWRVTAYGTSAPPKPGWPPAWWMHDPIAALVTDRMLAEARKRAK